MSEPSDDLDDDLDEATVQRILNMTSEEGQKLMDEHYECVHYVNAPAFEDTSPDPDDGDDDGDWDDEAVNACPQDL